MFHKAFFITILAFLAAVTAISIPSTCGGTNNSPCPLGQICCSISLMTPAVRNACVAGDVCPL
ncbi:hypothetical protein K438DRAFT_1965153 [Mycena galopus ATCC 62051]|nr:hypothetical protein K438DRAFT_1965153 [Mycena galopus ATCC 62051]